MAGHRRTGAVTLEALTYRGKRISRCDSSSSPSTRHHLPVAKVLVEARMAADAKRKALVFLFLALMTTLVLGVGLPRSAVPAGHARSQPRQRPGVGSACRRFAASGCGRQCLTPDCHDDRRCGVPAHYGISGDERYQPEEPSSRLPLLPTFSPDPSAPSTLIFLLPGSKGPALPEPLPAPEPFVPVPLGPVPIAVVLRPVGRGLGR